MIDHPPTPATTISATAYCTGTQTADGGRPYFGEAASNELPLQALIRISPGIRPPHGQPRTLFRIRDRIGSGSRLDFYIPWGREPDCAFGRRTLRVTRIR